MSFYLLMTRCFYLQCSLIIEKGQQPDRMYDCMYYMYYILFSGSRCDSLWPNFFFLVKSTSGHMKKMFVAIEFFFIDLIGIFH